MTKHLKLRFCYWLVCWVQLANALVEIASLTAFDLGGWLDRCADWLEGIERKP